MKRVRNATVHECICEGRPICDVHGALEWGGGEPDKCQPHGHGLVAALVQAAAEFMSHVQSIACDHDGALGGTHTGCPERLKLDDALRALAAKLGEGEG